MSEDVTVTLRLKVRLSLWDAIKVRIAGRAAEGLIDTLIEGHEPEIPPDDRR